ncbi:hypothetical protein QJS04_geneDACA020607 [Acorus gramineus]|uniref:Small-subunit processome Utp12 domain-containing protein n=1 Tax=Acorus gramineus TaxID=55184 RepID=A0AAV9B9Y6_ACOGR|nr:hypothetical protein QJS04_geneDACA020607 [Acorus gramineus]
MMSTANIRDILTSFSPNLDFFASTSGDGRIKIWDTLKGQIQTEFTNITASDDTGLFSGTTRGHLSLDYTCMKWVQSDAKKKRKPGHSLLVLGTGSGDILAFDVSAGQLRWKVSDCHPGGVTAVCSPRNGLCVYTAGADGMVCQIESATGNVTRMHKSSTKAISALSVSADGKILATASAQLRIFNCADNKKIQKFTGHPMAVRCLIFTEDVKYALSSAAGEKNIAIWRIDGVKKQSSCCVLSMEHPAVFLDSKGSDGTGVYVLAISEIGLCYLWYGKNIEELRNCKPTKISLSIESSHRYNSGPASSILAAKFQGVEKPASALVLVAHGSVVKPSFDRCSVQYGVDIRLNSSQNGVLLPTSQSYDSVKGQKVQNRVTALDRANAEDALLPPMLHDFHDKKRKHDHHLTRDDKDMMSNPEKETPPMDLEVDWGNMEEDGIVLEDRLRSAGILGDLCGEHNPIMPADNITDDTMLKNAELLVKANMPEKKIREKVLSMSHNDAYRFLEVLVALWERRSASGVHVLPWIHRILVNHGSCFPQESSTQTIDKIYKMAKFKCVSVQPLLQLSGRLQLIMAQIDKVGQNLLPNMDDSDESQDEDEREEIDEIVYGEEEDSAQSGSDDD